MTTTPNENGYGFMPCLSAFVFAVVIAAGMPAAAFAQEAFGTPQQAVDALVGAARADRIADLLKILGPRAKKLVRSGDAVADNLGREKFTAVYDKAHRLEDKGNGKQVLIVGEEEWPMPIPLVHRNGGWVFDAESGGQEILNRRIGRNELNVIGVCRTYVEAQREFGALHPLAGNRRAYAQKFLSGEGWHDGLYWPVKDGEPESPFGPLIASATTEGYLHGAGHEPHSPYHGYYYKILKGQGAHAEGGTMSYVNGSFMTRGFALAAFPAEYGNSGIMTFVVNQNGIVFQKNLGPKTAAIAAGISAYDPDESWNIIQ